ncbi:hypothetical protein BC826DRAFT_1187026 [Russula brevipes]|nr:hypothetical protein BC826DRAFT_1187026 [Russula brevipes]
MRYPITRNFHVLRRAAADPAIQTGRVPAPQTRTLATVGSRMTSDQADTPRNKTKFGLDRDTLYIGGGLAAIGAIWYYYATVENARIERKRERLDSPVATANADGSRKPSVEDAPRSVKNRAQDALKNVH